MAHIAGHDKAADSGGAAQHGESGHQLVVPEAHGYRDGQEDAHKDHQLEGGGGEGGLDAADSFLPIKGGAQGHESQRGTGGGDAVHGFGEDGRLGNAQQGPGQANDNTQNDGIGDNSLGHFLGRPLGKALLSGAGEGEYRHRRRVIEGDRANDDQAGGPGAAVEVLQKGGAQQSHAAAVAHLNEFPSQWGFFQHTAEQGGEQDGGQSGQKTEYHKGGVPHLEKVGAGQVLEHHDGQAHFKHIAVELIGKGLAEKAHFTECDTQQHEQKNGYSTIETIDQIVQHDDLLQK